MKAKKHNADYDVKLIILDLKRLQKWYRRALVTHLTNVMLVKMVLFFFFCKNCSIKKKGDKRTILHVKHEFVTQWEWLCSIEDNKYHVLK